MANRFSHAARRVNDYWQVDSLGDRAQEFRFLVARDHISRRRDEARRRKHAALICFEWSKDVRSPNRRGFRVFRKSFPRDEFLQLERGIDIRIGEIRCGVLNQGIALIPKAVLAPLESKKLAKACEVAAAEIREPLELREIVLVSDL